MGSPIKFKATDRHGKLVTKRLQIDYLPADPALKALWWTGTDVVYGAVLGWKISTTFVPEGEEYELVEPITHDGTVAETHVLYPDGTIRYFDEVYDSLEEFIGAMKMWEQEKLKGDAALIAKSLIKKNSDI
jgi:hypothetical protein